MVDDIMAYNPPGQKSNNVQGDQKTFASKQPDSDSGIKNSPRKAARGKSANPDYDPEYMMWKLQNKKQQCIVNGCDYPTKGLHPFLVFDREADCINQYSLCDTHFEMMKKGNYW